VAGTRLHVLEAFDRGQLTSRYWLLFGLLMVNTVVEFFDFFVVGFLVSIVGPEWGLTFGQSSMILLTAGLGQVLGALPMAWAADRFGRRPVLLACTCLYSGAAGLIAFVPDGGWVEFALLRFFVGVGYSGVVTSQLALLVEFSPTRHRTMISNAAGAFAPIGVLLASASVGLLVPVLGWRNLALLGATPLLLVVLLYFIVPESVRWLVANGRGNEAEKLLRKYMRLPPGELDTSAPADTATRRDGSLLDLYALPSRFWLILVMTIGLGMGGHGVAMWGPTFLSLVLEITPVEAAKYFVWISLSGLAGRFLFTVVPAKIGRWPAALLCCWAAAVLLTIAGLFPTAFVGPVSLFFLCLLVAALFYDGGFTNLLPYASELYPVSLAARGAALAHAASGVAKLGAPAILGLVAGTSTKLTPEAAQAAITPGFLLLAACCAAGGIMLLRFRYETHGRPMALDLADAKARGD
jgi:MFS transporter, putative metabolite:H+ symporter